jgi:hypothetical protein
MAQKNEMRIRKEYEEFAKTVIRRLFRARSQLWRWLSWITISGIGLAPLKDPMTRPTAGDCSRSTFNSLQSTPTNLQKWNSKPKFGIRTYLRSLEPSVSTSSRTNGRLPSPLELLSYLSRPSSASPSPTIHRTPWWPASTNKTVRSSMITPNNGFPSTPRRR